MNAIELASRMNENTHSIYRVDAVAAGKMLRRQHEAILKLREALVEVSYHLDGEHFARWLIKNALKETEDLK